MGVGSTAGQIDFINYNDRNPPFGFQDMGPNTNFTISFWTLTVLPAPGFTNAFQYNGTDGSYWQIFNDGINWYCVSRQGSVGAVSRLIAPVAVGEWTAWTIIKNTTSLFIFYGTEDPSVPGYKTNPVTMYLALAYPTSLTFEFNHMILSCTGLQGISNFRYWNGAIGGTQVQEAAHRWDAGVGPLTGVMAPIWASTFRTPSDTANIVNPYAGPGWAQGHAWTYISPSSSNLIRINYADHDPSYLALNMSSPAWVYPIGYKIPENDYINNAGSTLVTDSFIDPGNTPLVPTTYKAPQFFMFNDTGSVPLIDSQVSSITHLGYAQSDPAEGQIPSDTWALYHDESSAEISPNKGDPNNRFEQDTLVVPPGIKASTMFFWQFGAQFTYQPGPLVVNAATGHLIDILLYIVYTGIPSGIPGKTYLHFDNTAGLFAILKNSAIDQYNNGVSVKIPDPTIKTAYLGE